MVKELTAPSRVAELSSGKTPFLSEATQAKEHNPATHIKQVSLSITCIDEGKHIPRMIGKLSRQVLPHGAEMLAVISDNGSRGAREILEPEAQLTKQRQEIMAQLQDQPAGALEGFHNLLSVTQQLRSIDLTYLDGASTTEEHLHQRNTALQDQEHLLGSLPARFPSSTQSQLLDYVLQEGLQRERLREAVLHPEKMIASADQKEEHFTKGKNASSEQLETVRAYAQILLGKFQDPAHPFRVQIVAGSETGSFGSARKYGVEAVLRDWEQRHPGEDPQSHAVFAGFDMDSDFNDTFFQEVIRGFETHPEAKALYTSLTGVKDKKNAPGEIKPHPLARIPGLKKIGSVFGDVTNMIEFFSNEGADVRKYLPPGHGIIGRLGLPNLLIGPAILVRGDILGRHAPDDHKHKQVKVSMRTAAGQGEDIDTTTRFRRAYPEPQHTAVIPDAVLGFNFRGYNVAGLLFDRENNIVPYRHKGFRETLGSDYPDWRARINAHMYRDTLVGDNIRRIDEARVGLAPNEYVARLQWADTLPLSEGSLTLPQPGTESAQPPSPALTTRDVYFSDIVLQRTMLAKVVQLDIPLAEDEYIARPISSRQASKLQTEQHRGERIVTVQEKVRRRRRELEQTRHYLIRTHLPEEDITQRVSIAEPVASALQ